MRRICAWCKRELNMREELSTDGEITHGICSPCAIQFTRSTPKTIREILNIITEPIFVLDSQGTVISANENGKRFTGKNYADFENHLGGDVLECSYAKLPEGCGRTEHCKTCAIRNIVMDTLANGRGYTNVPAFQFINTPGGARIMRFYISTEKVDDYILLRIDDAVDHLSV
jgi:hypothetical protein